MQICLEHEDDFYKAKKIQAISIFWNVRDQVKHLWSIAKATETCQSDTGSIADTCVAWLLIL